MNRAENIKRMYEQAKLDTITEKDKAVLEKMKEIYLRESKAENNISELSVWRIIMKSNIIRFAAAVVIIVAILLTLNNSSVDITSNVYAEITENMQEMPWVYIRIIAESQTDDEKRTAVVDLWYSNNEQVIGMKDSYKSKYSYYQNEKKYDYDLDTNSITVSSIDQSDYSNSLINLQKGFDSWIMQFSQSNEGDEINHYLGELEGEKAEIYEYQSEDGSGKLYVNSVSRLPMYAEFNNIYKNNLVNTQIHFEFPESGPRDIYDIGVPNDAQIIEN
ncbi:MAG: hypothetical protein JW787_06655 [Sedimentisphaerales bacterium]|nr:hypothetical protein [Sedimentisphaerales bacterium]